MGKSDRPVLPSGVAHAEQRLGASRWFIYAALLLGLGWLLLRPNGGDAAGASRRPADVAWDDWDAVREIFAFGDSWTTTDFNVDGPQPSDANPMGNPAFPNDPHKKTPDWITYLTASYNNSLIYTYNLARGAATIDRDIVAPLFTLTQTLSEQVRITYVNNYARGKQHSARWPPPNRLAIVFFGLVDLSLLSRAAINDFTIVDELIKSYESSLDELVDSGIRHLLLLTAPPMDMAPAPDNLDILAALIGRFNDRLLGMGERFRRRHAEVAFRVFDLHTLLVKLAHDPAALPQTAGIRNVTRACFEYNPDMYILNPQAWNHFDARCGIARDEYFWANGLHPTHPVQEAIAAMIAGECFGAADALTGRRGWGLCE